VLSTPIRQPFYSVRVSYLSTLCALDVFMFINLQYLFFGLHKTEPPVPTQYWPQTIFFPPFLGGGSHKLKVCYIMEELHCVTHISIDISIQIFLLSLVKYLGYLDTCIGISKILM